MTFCSFIIVCVCVCVCVGLFQFSAGIFEIGED